MVVFLRFRLHTYYFLLMRPLFYGSTHGRTNGTYCLGIFGRYSVGISPVLPIPYRRKTWSVHFGIEKGPLPPFFLKRGAMAPFLRSSNPLLDKRGEERGEVYKKGGNGDPHVAASYSFCRPPKINLYLHQLTLPSAETKPLIGPWYGPSVRIVSAPGVVG